MLKYLANAIERSAYMRQNCANCMKLYYLCAHTEVFRSVGKSELVVSILYNNYKSQLRSLQKRITLLVRSSWKP